MNQMSSSSRINLSRVKRRLFPPMATRGSSPRAATADILCLLIHAQTGCETSNGTCTNEITKLLKDWSGGDSTALDRVIPLVYDELHRLAHQHMRRERAGHLLQTSALINEAYLRLMEQPELNLREPYALLWHCSTFNATDTGR